MAGPPVLPVAVIEVAGEQHEADLPFQRQVDEVAQRLPRGGADALGRRIRVKAAHRTVEMQVGGVQELETCHRASLEQYRLKWNRPGVHLLAEAKRGRAGADVDANP